MHPTSSSLNIQNIVSKFPDFITLQRLGRKLYGHSFSWEILDRLIYFVYFISEGKDLILKCPVLLLELFLPFPVVR